MKSRIEAVKKEYAEIQEKLSSPELVSDSKKMAELGKRQAELEEIIVIINELEKAEHDMKGNAEIMNTETDEEMKRMAMEENIELSR
ncbi:MAG: PCRF domain-containing protein, partial [Parcubacteria group bacterium]